MKRVFVIVLVFVPLVAAQSTPQHEPPSVEETLKYISLHVAPIENQRNFVISVTEHKIHTEVETFQTWKGRKQWMLREQWVPALAGLNVARCYTTDGGGCVRLNCPDEGRCIKHSDGGNDPSRTSTAVVLPFENDPEQLDRLVRAFRHLVELMTPSVSPNDPFAK